jgi:SAM-dependent methyltransferase
MPVCPDCRAEMADPQAACAHCHWAPRLGPGFLDYLASKDRKSSRTAELIETYDTLAERDWSAAGEADSYVEGLHRRLSERLGDLSGKDVCDVGSDRGFFIKYALARGARMIAVDITEISLRHLAKAYGIPCYLANAENLPFRNAFDVLVATDILGLLPNMANFLVTANWALRDGGIFAIRVPYRENQLFYSNFHGLPVHFTQLRTFDRTLIIDLVRDAGFKVERVFYDGFRPDYMVPWLNRYPRWRRRLQDWIVARYGADDASAAPLCRFLMKPIEIGVIARKTTDIVPVNAHRAFAAFAEQRRRRREKAAL